MSTDPTPSMTNTAGGYVFDSGWHVFPLHNVTPTGCSCGKGCERKRWGKHPRTFSGLLDATTSPEQIREWWGQWPDANIGARTGATTDTVMIGPDGAKGVADLHALEEELGPLPKTRHAKSGSGGQHYYFRWPADGLPIKNRKNHLGTAIDVRGDGGYFVAPPSVNGFSAYEWIDDKSDLTELPPAWADWCRTDGRKEEAPPTGEFTATATGSSNRPPVIERATKYLAKMDPSVSGQRGHNRLFAAARAMVHGFCLSADDAFALLAGEFNPRCLPPWSEREILHKVREAGSKPSKLPKGWLLGDDDRFTGGNRQHVSGEKVEPASNSRDNRDRDAECATWQPPAPLPDMPPVSAFPIEVIPPKVADYWLAGAESLGVPVDTVAVPGLALLGASVGRARALGIKRGYVEFPALWTVLVNPAGSTKSAALKAARGPISEAERKWVAEHRQKMLEFNTEEERYRQAHKEWKAAGCEGMPPDKPKAPALRQLTLDDTTTEAAALVLADNPKGVAIVKDELDGWVLGRVRHWMSAVRRRGRSSTRPIRGCRTSPAVPPAVPPRRPAIARRCV